VTPSKTERGLQPGCRKKSLHQSGGEREILRKPSSLQQYVLARAGARLHCFLHEEANQKVQEFHRHLKCSRKDVEGLQK
jgi:hypothetical protein